MELIAAVKLLSITPLAKKKTLLDNLVDDVYDGYRESDLYSCTCCFLACEVGASSIIDPVKKTYRSGFAFPIIEKAEPDL